MKIKVMPNMSYCRFENTYRDLMDCYHNMENSIYNDREIRYKKQLIDLCAQIADQYTDFVFEEDEEEETEPQENLA